MESSVPLFPLHTVLFPGGPLPLRIFEPRYLEMISDCLKRDREFGVVLIDEGREVGDVASCFEVGTLARIIDWDQRDDGLLGITCMGGSRFRTHSKRVQDNQLMVAEIELLAPCGEARLPDHYSYLAEALSKLIERLGRLYASLPTKYDDAAWVANRLGEILPLSLKDKQELLEIDDPLTRLDRLAIALGSL